MIKRTGKIVEYGNHIYEFGSEEDAIGFVGCCNGQSGRPVTCATQWRCISQKIKVKERDTGLER